MSKKLQNNRPVRCAGQKQHLSVVLPAYQLLAKGLHDFPWGLVWWRGCPAWPLLQLKVHQLKMQRKPGISVGAPNHCRFPKECSHHTVGVWNQSFPTLRWATLQGLTSPICPHVERVLFGRIVHREFAWIPKHVHPSVVHAYHWT